jgi:phosphohistidine phosphatase SixA
MLKKLACCVLACLLSVTVAGGEEQPFTTVKASPALLEKLRAGGFVLYMRHGKTDPRQPDQVPIRLDDCGTQRPLTQEGRAEIAAVGEALRRARIPIEEVFCSPLCRAVESAKIAYGPAVQVENNLMYTAHLTTAQKEPVLAKTRELLSRPLPVGGKNRVLVAHAPNIADLMGYFPEVEGTVIVFRPLANGQFSYVASILPNEWAELLEGR